MAPQSQYPEPAGAVTGRSGGGGINGARQGTLALQLQPPQPRRCNRARGCASARRRPSSRASELESTILAIESTFPAESTTITTFWTFPLASPPSKAPWWAEELCDGPLC